MPRITNKITGIQGVAAGNTAIFQLPTDRRYHEILLEYGSNAVPAPTLAQMDDEIDLIRIKANSTSIREFKPSELAAVMSNKLGHVANGFIPIMFSEPWRATRLEEEAFSLNAKGFASLEVQIIFKSGTFIPTLSGDFSFDYRQDNNRAFMKWERHNVPLSSAGAHEWVTLDKVGALSTLHILSPNVTRVRVLSEGVEVLDRTKASNRELLKGQGFGVDSNIFPVMFDYTGYADDVLPLVKTQGNATVPVSTFMTQIYSSASGNIPVIVERAVFL